MSQNPRAKLTAQLQERILILDGGMGTMIQRCQFSEEEFRGTQFADWPSDLKGNNDLLSMTQPERIKALHKGYLDAGADIIETNSFNSTSIAMADYDMQDLARDINVAAARDHGITVTNTPGAVTDATADIGLTLLLMSARRGARPHQPHRQYQPGRE